MPCSSLFAKPEDLVTWPNHHSLPFLNQGQEFIIFSNGCLDFFHFLMASDDLSCLDEVLHPHIQNFEIELRNTHVHFDTVSHLKDMGGVILAH